MVAIDTKKYAWTIDKHLQKGQEKVVDKQVKLVSTEGWQLKNSTRIVTALQ